MSGLRVNRFNRCRFCARVRFALLGAVVTSGACKGKLVGPPLTESGGAGPFGAMAGETNSAGVGGCGETCGGPSTVAPETGVTFGSRNGRYFVGSSGVGAKVIGPASEIGGSSGSGGVNGSMVSGIEFGLGGVGSRSVSNRGGEGGGSVGANGSSPRAGGGTGSNAVASSAHGSSGSGGSSVGVVTSELAGSTPLSTEGGSGGTSVAVVSAGTSGKGGASAGAGVEAFGGRGGGEVSLARAGASPINRSADQNWVPLAPEVIAGTDIDGTPLAICRAPYEGGKHPGEFRVGVGFACKIGWDDSVYAIEAPDVFEGLQLAWERRSCGEIPADAYPFGVEPNLQPLYPCRGIIDGQYQLGRVGAGEPGCQVSLDGDVRLIEKDYEVLINAPLIHFPIDAEYTVQSDFPPMYALRGVPLTANSYMLFLCSAAHEGGIYPGKLRSDWTHCNITYDRKEISVDTYKVLMPSFKPHDSVGRTFWAGGVEGYGDKLGICRAKLSGGLHLGKYLVSKDQCNIPFDGSEFRVLSDESFEVLRP